MTTSDRLKQECVKGSWVRKEKTCSSPKRYSPFQLTDLQLAGLGIIFKRNPC